MSVLYMRPIDLQDDRRKEENLGGDGVGTTWHGMLGHRLARYAPCPHVTPASKGLFVVRCRGYS